MTRDIDSDFDVAVVGGGPAGLGAALAASALGARTLLVDPSEHLGGNAANALVHTICGLHELPDPEADRGVPARIAHAGLPRRLAEALERCGAASPAERAGRVHYLPIDPLGFSALASDWCQRSEHLETWLGTTLLAADLGSEPDSRYSLTLGGRAGTRIARAQVTIDASGDGALAAQVGAHMLASAPGGLQRASFIFRLAGVAPTGVEGFARVRLSHAVAGAVRGGRLPEGCESVTLRPGLAPGQAYVTLTLPKDAAGGYDPLDPESLRRLHDWATDAADAVAAFLRETRPPFSRAAIDLWPRRVGVRESRRIEGRAVISAEDVLEGRRCDDEVARSTWPIELWDDHRRPRFLHPKSACSVPLGALVSRAAPRLGMAGRCLSASHEAHGALRVIGTALATGQAIGVAAALAADRGCGLDAIAPEQVRGEILRMDEPGALP